MLSAKMKDPMSEGEVAVKIDFILFLIKKIRKFYTLYVLFRKKVMRNKVQVKVIKKRIKKSIQMFFFIPTPN